VENSEIKQNTPHESDVIYNKPTLFMRGLVMFLRLCGNQLRKERMDDFQKKLKQRSKPVAAKVPESLKELCQVTEETINGYPVFHLTPWSSKISKHVLYTHGGAYVNTLRREHWNLIESIIRQTRASFTVPTYPLAPENDHRGAFDILDQVYASLCENIHASKIVFMGDSAGGGLALAQALRYRSEGLNLPGRLILIAPWVDITNSTPGMDLIEPKDPMLGIESTLWCGQAWAGELDARNPLVSPLFGDLSDLPPIDIYQGSLDLLAPASRRLKDKVNAAGGQARLFEYNGAFHVFPAFTFTAEAKDVVRRIDESLRSE
jgi:acetyl esterase/lipase